MRYIEYVAMSFTPVLPGQGPFNYPNYTIYNDYEENYPAPYANNNNNQPNNEANNNWGAIEHDASNYTDLLRLSEAAITYRIPLDVLKYWTNLFLNFPSNPKEKYLLKQYTHHGDRILNSYLLLTDTIKTYDVNTFNPDKASYTFAKIPYLQSNHFFCLFLLDIEPYALTQGNYIDKSERDFSKSLDQLYRLKNRGFIEWYKSEIYDPHIRPSLDTGDLALYRKSLDDIIPQFRTICASHPSISTKRQHKVYRGVNDMFYQLDGNMYELTTFQSTSLSSIVAKNFGAILCEFILHHDCEFAYVEQITIHQDEFEVLLTPKNRYKFIERDSTQNIYRFVVLPPLTSAKPRAKLTRTQKSRLQRKRAKAAAAAGGDGAAAGGGGGAANAKMRRATKLTRRRMMYGGQVKPANMNANTNTANATTNKALNKPIANTINMSNVPPFSDPEELKKPNSRWTFIGPSINLGPPSAKENAQIAELLALK